MVFWSLIAAMTGGAILLVLWPLAQHRQGGSSQKHSLAGDIAVFQGELEEISRDQTRGLLDSEAAKAMQDEGRRRLIAAHAATAGELASIKPQYRRTARRLAAFAALVGIPALAALFYGYLGQPFFPYPAQTEARVVLQEGGDLLAAVESRLNLNPDDARGWEVLGPIYRRMGRYDDAVLAFENVLRLRGASAERLSDLGEALVLKANGVIHPRAEALFEQAHALDERAVRPRFFGALQLYQTGRYEAAVAAWEALLAEAGSDTGWAPLAENNLKLARQALQGEAAEIANLPIAERQEMVVAMVEGLAARLQENPDNLAGWLRLIRAYHVLEEPEKAEIALEKARIFFADEPNALEKLNNAAKTNLTVE